MNKWFRFLIHAMRLRSFALAAWIVDYEEAEQRFHTAIPTGRKGDSPPPCRKCFFR